MSDVDTTYNGWANYGTWVVGMYLDGNYTGEGTYLEVLELTREVLADDERAKLGQAIRDYVENDLPADGLAGDLIGVVLCEVDWDELAEHKADEVLDA